MHHCCAGAVGAWRRNLLEQGRAAFHRMTHHAEIRIFLRIRDAWDIRLLRQQVAAIAWD